MIPIAELPAESEGAESQLAASSSVEPACAAQVAPCFLPSFLAGPYWILEFNDEEGWAIVSGGPPTQEAAGGCRTGPGRILRRGGVRRALQ